VCGSSSSSKLPQNYAGAVIQDLHQQNYHPVVVLGTGGYSESFVSSSGAQAMPTASGSSGHGALSRGGRIGSPGRQDVPPLGPGGESRIQGRPLHLLRLALRRSCSPRQLKAAGSDPSRGRFSNSSGRSRHSRWWPGRNVNPAKQGPEQLLTSSPGSSTGSSSATRIPHHRGRPTGSAVTRPISTRSRRQGADRRDATTGS